MRRKLLALSMVLIGIGSVPGAPAEAAGPPLRAVIPPTAVAVDDTTVYLSGEVVGQAATGGYEFNGSCRAVVPEAPDAGGWVEVFCTIDDTYFALSAPTPGRVGAVAYGIQEFYPGTAPFQFCIIARVDPPYDYTSSVCAAAVPIA